MKLFLGACLVGLGRALASLLIRLLGDPRLGTRPPESPNKNRRLPIVDRLLATGALRRMGG